jgi:hypothetical protein
MEEKEENIYKVLAMSILGYAVICLAMIGYASSHPPIDLDTYFKLRYGY